VYRADIAHILNKFVIPFVPGKNKLRYNGIRRNIRYNVTSNVFSTPCFDIVCSGRPSSTVCKTHQVLPTLLCSGWGRKNASLTAHRYARLASFSRDFHVRWAWPLTFWAEN